MYDILFHLGSKSSNLILPSNIIAPLSSLRITLWFAHSIQLVGWILFVGLKINYPILFGKTSPKTTLRAWKIKQFYLNRWKIFEGYIVWRYSYGVMCFKCAKIVIGMLLGSSNLNWVLKNSRIHEGANLKHIGEQKYLIVKCYHKNTIATTNFERTFQDNFAKQEYHMMKQSKSQVSKVSPCHHSMGVHG